MDAYGSDFWASNGGTILSSLINAYSQYQTNEANKEMVADTNSANKAISDNTNATNIHLVGMTNASNMALNRENIAFQQQENEITRAREDNAVQRRALDLAKAGLSKTLSAGNPASANALQAPQNTLANNAPQISKYEQQAFLKKAIQADLASLDNSVLNRDYLKAQVENARTQNRKEEVFTRYQELVNEYFEKNGTLPGTNEYINLYNAVLRILGYDDLEGVVNDVADKLENTNNSNSSSTSSSHVSDEELNRVLKGAKKEYDSLSSSKKKKFLRKIVDDVTGKDSFDNLNTVNVRNIKDFLRQPFKIDRSVFL